MCQIFLRLFVLGGKNGLINSVCSFKRGMILLHLVTQKC